MVHGIVDERRVHNDIAMVGQKQVGATGPQLFDAGVGDPVRGAFDGVVDVIFNLVLQRGDRVDTGELAAQLACQGWLQQPAECARKAGKAKSGQNGEKGFVAQQTCQDGGDFCIVVRSDGIKFAHHALLFESNRVKRRRIC